MNTYKTILRTVSVLSLIMIATGVFLMNGDISDSYYDAESYQSVLLTNGDIYFGQIIDDSRDVMVLANAHYPQIQNVQGEDPETPQQSLQIIPVAGQIIQPSGEVIIPKTSVLLIQNLLEDSPVVVFIEGQNNSSEEAEVTQEIEVAEE